MFVELSIIEEIDIIKREIENEEKQIEKLYNRIATESKNPIEIKFTLYEIRDHKAKLKGYLKALEVLKKIKKEIKERQKQQQDKNERG